MKTFFRFFALVVLVSSAFAQQASDSINLVFTGSGSVLANRSSFENKYNFKTKRYESGVTTSTGRQAFNGSGNVEIAGSMARIKLPSQMVALLNSGDHGWFMVSRLVVSESEITGTVVINGLNKPKLRINRNSGIITIEGGFSDFTGQCEVVKAGVENRKF